MRPRAGRRQGLAEPAGVGPDDAMAGRETRNERVPHPAVGDAGMQEDDRLARALIVEGQAARGPAAVRGIPDRVAAVTVESAGSPKVVCVIRGVSDIGGRHARPGPVRPILARRSHANGATDHAAARPLARPYPTSLGCADGRPAGRTLLRDRLDPAVSCVDTAGRTSMIEEDTCAPVPLA